MQGTRIFQMAMAAGALAFSMNALAQSDRDRDKTPSKETTSQSDKDRMSTMELKRLSQVMRLQVQTQDGAPAGRIDELAVHADSGYILYAIVDTQDAPDLGNQTKAVPFRAIKFRQGQQTAQINIDMNRFQNAPPFDESGWTTIGDDRWSEVVHRHYGVQQRKVFEDDDEERGRSIVKASTLLEMKIANEQRQELASIDDAAVDVNRGRIVYALITPEQRESRERLVALPWMAIEDVRPADRMVLVDINRQRLQEAPTFTSLEELSRPQSMQKVFAFYNVERDGVYGFVEPDDDDDVMGGGAAERFTGWDHRSEYGRMFNANRMESLQGEVTSIDRFAPMSGMAEGVRVRLRAQGNETQTVHLGPAWYVQHQDLQFNEGDQVRVRACRVQVDGNTVYIATEIRRGDEVLLLRDREGRPRWDASFRVSEIQGSSDSTPDRGRRPDRNPDRD